MLFSLGNVHEWNLKLCIAGANIVTWLHFPATRLHEFFQKNQEDERKHPNALPVAIESSRTFWYQSRWANNCHNRKNIVVENARWWIKVRGTAWWPSSSSAAVVSHRLTIQYFSSLYLVAHTQRWTLCSIGIIMKILLLRFPLPLVRYHLNVMGIIKKLLLKVFGCKKQVLQRADLPAYVTRSLQMNFNFILPHKIASGSLGTNRTSFRENAFKAISVPEFHS